MGLRDRIKGSLETRQTEHTNVEAIKALALAAVEDDVVTQDEEDALFERLDECGWTFDDFSTRLPETLVDAFHIARINDGRLPVADDSALMTKAGEGVHIDVPAGLAKEVIDRRFVGGSRGVSVPLGLGIRFRVGAFQGHTEVIGSHYETADSGRLVVTSKRLVFMGQRKTVECRYDKLIGMEAFSDAIKISVSNRQNASMFFVPKVTVISAIISAAAHKAS